MSLVDPRIRLAADLYNLGLTHGLAAPEGNDVLLEARKVPLPFGTLELSTNPKEFLWSGFRMTRFIAVAEVKCRYRAPVYYDEEVVVRTRLKSVRASVVVFSYELVRADTNVLLAEGETTHIVTNSKMKVAALPEKYLTAFRAATGK